MEEEEEQEVQVMSTCLVQAPTQPHDMVSNIELTPWDLQPFQSGGIQKGLLFHKPKSFNLENLKTSLASSLNFFPLLSGRLSIIQHSNNTSSVFIVPNNLGVLLVHAVAPNITLSHILNSTYIPSVVHSFFSLNGVKNFQGTSHPLLAIQVTELIDGVFIGFTVNHCVMDGTSFWHFVNTWAAISKGCDPHTLSNPVSFERWFPENIHRPIHYSFPIPKNDVVVSQPPPPERVFHFSKQNINNLKAKAMAETTKALATTKLSSLQVVVSHIWRCIIKHRRLEPNQKVTCRVAIGTRQRISDPPLTENYVGNGFYASDLTMEAGELEEEGGLGKVALEMNKMIALYTEEKLKELYVDWVRNPVFPPRGKYVVSTSGSPLFDTYSNDFGWGKPVAVRSGAANKIYGKINVYRGAEEEGSMDVEVCFDYEILEAMANDQEFMEAVTI